VIVDTSALLAFFDGSDPNHDAVADAIVGHRGALIIPPLVLAELDYLVLRCHGSSAELAVLRALADGAWQFPAFGPDLLRRAAWVVERFGEHAIGLTDASLIVLAETHKTRRIATLDRRHFTILRFADGSAPEIHPS
jgi:predicted nucleic acid-binding protein